ncbi:hypothetical protein CP97_08710 [Aurantiacibacter atlanticus]|uniref:Uncharacterized protein n=1 Tax=Aurantiacibacter atlanticus TaxID=1648404 RepID=A0A0H4VBR0_9SPHN|nr:hypothetical protein CP97_08710 [Aurantiacibacter atlanticus]
MVWLDIHGIANCEQVAGVANKGEGEGLLLGKYKAGFHGF